MAWSAPTEWERWNPDQLLQCPYDEVHRIPAKRYQYHILKCREQHPEKDFVACPFNAKHVMLRSELRQHIARCTDKGEVEPYSYKGCEQDSEGFYFKGDTSVPSYRREEMSIPPEDDWDRDDEETTTQQNLCEYYKQKQEKKTPASNNHQGIQDILSLQHSERDKYKDSIRNSAMQQPNSYHGDGYHRNYQNHQCSSQIPQQPTHNINMPQVRPIYQSSSNSNNNHHGNHSNHMSSQPSQNMLHVRPIYQPPSSHSNSSHGNQSSAPASTHPSHNISPTRAIHDPSSNSHTFRGAGRARLAEEAKRSQFGIQSTFIIGRGRGMLGFQ